MWKPQLGSAEVSSKGLKWLGSRAAEVYKSGQQGLTSSHDLAIRTAFCSPYLLIWAAECQAMWAGPKLWNGNWTMEKMDGLLF